MDKIHIKYLYTSIRFGSAESNIQNTSLSSLGVLRVRGVNDPAQMLCQREAPRGLARALELPGAET